MSFQEQLATLEMMELKLTKLQAEVALLQQQKQQQDVNLQEQAERERQAWEFLNQHRTMCKETFTCS